jgi:imidazolonepropionase
MQPAPTSTPRTRFWRNASLATMAGDAGIGIVAEGAVLVRGERIVYAGAERSAPADAYAGEVIDCDGRWITPGLIDCHTHLVHAGHRADEFEQRLRGVTYAEIAAAGGGILSTLRATRAATPEALLAQTLPRLDALIAEGVTTIEVKSGYGLDFANERKMLEVARSLATRRRIGVKTTFLGAHALPPEAGGDRDAYIDEVLGRMLPAFAADGLVDAVDGFCESIAFTPAQIARVFAAAEALGLPVKLHADQLTNLQGAALAASHNAMSADHLEHADEAGVLAMARAGTVAVLLPGAYYFLRDTHLPPIGLLRSHGVRMAVATDSNPGTSPLTSLLLAMNMAATQFRLTVAECLAGTTREAARALRVDRETGSLEAGKYADLAIWSIGSPSELVYRMGFNPLHERVWRGQ